jgi:hypothetical protein
VISGSHRILLANLLLAEFITAIEIASLLHLRLAKVHPSFQQPIVAERDREDKRKQKVGPTNFESDLLPRSLAESGPAQTLLIFWHFGSECQPSCLPITLPIGEVLTGDDCVLSSIGGDPCFGGTESSLEVC